MSENSAIEWTHHTFNPWWGCTKVSPGCSACYAEAFDKRVGGAHWGPGVERRTFGEKHWNEPKKWDAKAAKLGERHRVFCSSMADVFDAEAPAGQIERLWPLIRETPHLDWLLLTKRPERIGASLPADWGDGYPNVWLGTSVEDQARAEERIPHLLHVPAVVRFLSMEPLLGAVSLDRWFGLKPGAEWEPCLCAEIAERDRPCLVCEGRQFLGERSGISWVIVGGESGPKARPFDVQWAIQTIQACKDAGVPVFFKQAGRVPFDSLESDRYDDAHPEGPAHDLSCRLDLVDPKGGDLDELDERLHVREWPRGAVRR